MLTGLTESRLSCVVLSPGRPWRVGSNWPNPSLQKLEVTFTATRTLDAGASQIPMSCFVLDCTPPPTLVIL